jgi:putative hydrolase of the HAD superfamily
MEPRWRKRSEDLRTSLKVSLTHDSSRATLGILWKQAQKTASARYDGFMAPRAPSGLALLIDADDTLWENNIYFERAIASFISFLNHQEYSPAQVRQVLNEVERECVVSHGYGLHSFAHALTRTFERLAVEPITPALHQTILGFTRAIAEHPVEVCPGVVETLEYLAGRHRLVLMTKGDRKEQAGKTERSGLKHYFEAVEIVAEKNVSAYHAAADKYDLSPRATWMIGNSPKSDVNPALAAGWNAVFIPHGDTWILEHEEVVPPHPPSRLLVVQTFAELREHF